MISIESAAIWVELVMIWAKPGWTKMHSLDWSGLLGNYLNQLGTRLKPIYSKNRSIIFESNKFFLHNWGNSKVEFCESIHETPTI